MILLDRDHRSSYRLRGATKIGALWADAATRVKMASPRGFEPCDRGERATALPQRCVNLLQHPRPRTKFLLRQLVERGLHGIEVGVEVFELEIEVEQPGDDLP